MATVRVIILGSKGVVDYMQVKPSTFSGAIEDAGIRAADLARRAGCTPQYISALRRGKRANVSPEMGLAIAKALGVSPESIFIPREAPTTATDADAA